MRRIILFGLVFVFSLLLAANVFAVPYAYISNTLESSVSIIDLATNSIINTISVGTSPLSIIMSPDRSRVYTADHWSGVAVIDTATKSRLAEISVEGGPTGITTNALGTKVFVSSYYWDRVSIIDTATNTVERMLTTGNAPGQVLLNPDESKIYVRNNGSNDTTVISTADYSTSTLAYDGSMLFNQDGKKLYIANSDSDTMSIIDLATNNTLTTTVGDYPIDLIMHPLGTKVYVANYNGNTISVVDTTTSLETKEIPVGVRPTAMAIDPKNLKLYIINVGDDTISIIDMATDLVVGTISGLSTSAVGIAVDPMAIISASDSSLSFNKTLVGNDSIKNLTIINNGTALLNISEINFSGRNKNDYSLQGDNCSSSSLKPLESCTLEIVFLPTGDGNRKAQIAIASNAYDNTLQKINLTGKGKYASGFVTKKPKANEIKIKKGHKYYADGVNLNIFKLPSDAKKVKYYLKFKKYNSYKIKNNQKYLKRYWRLITNLVTTNKNFKIKLIFKYKAKNYKYLKSKNSLALKKNLRLMFYDFNLRTWRLMNENYYWRNYKIKHNLTKRTFSVVIDDFQTWTNYFTIGLK